MSTMLTTNGPSRLRSLLRSRPLEMMREEMQDLVSRALGENADVWPLERMTPSLDLAETDDAIDVRVDIPGVDAKNLDIQVSGNVLTISGERKEEREEKGKTYHRVERRTGAFSRSVMLPCPVKESAVDARYHDGILTIRLPKAEEARSKKIAVKS